MPVVDLGQERFREAEDERAADLIRHFPLGPLGVNSEVPSNDACALDVGARDGDFSIVLAERFKRVVALDLNEPKIESPRVECQKGDVTCLPFPDQSFDFVLCAEVLEHVPSVQLALACGELARVTRGELLIGVPYRQDTRIGRTVCAACLSVNPPWGHVNEFDENRLVNLFPTLEVKDRTFAGVHRARTNRASTWLMDYAGNPYGTYTQLEGCIVCNATLVPPPQRHFLQKLATRSATILSGVQERLAAPRPRWIHMRFTLR